MTRFDRKGLAGVSPFLLISLFLFLHFCSSNPSDPLNPEEMRSIIGCYSDGRSTVVVDPDTLTVTDGSDVVATKRVRFTRGRDLAILTNLEMIRDRSTNAVRASKIDHDQFLFLRGPEDGRYMELHPNELISGGDNRPLILKRKSVNCSIQK